MRDLTSLIEAKAKAKMNQNIHKMHHDIRLHFKQVVGWGVIKITVDQVDYQLSQVIEGIGASMKNELPQYIEDESSEFYNKVEQLSDDVDELLNRAD